MTVAEKDREGDSIRREVFDLRVFVVGGGHQYIRMFYEAGFRGATSVGDADILCFTGGSDVDPSFYGEEPLPGTYYDTARDVYEKAVYEKGLEKNVAMIGICRGAQFLNVMNGGKLWQDVDNHCVGGHALLDTRSNKIVDGMTSTHHQQMRQGPDAEIVGVASLSTIKKAMGETLERTVPEKDDLEVLWYPKTLCLCFQPHPEFRHGECRDYFLDLVDEFILPAC